MNLPKQHDQVIDEDPEGDCPKCGSEVLAGFGLMGGGYGSYWVCVADDCDYFFKRQAEP